jgi:hypothetical protein
VENVFKIPDDQKMYLLKKLPETEQSHSEEIENEFLAEGDPPLAQRKQANIRNNIPDIDMKLKKKRKIFLNFKSEKTIKIKKPCEDTENPPK